MCRKPSQRDEFRPATPRLKQAWTVSSFRKRSSVSYSAGPTNLQCTVSPEF
jgi:hypothetical protein